MKRNRLRVPETGEVMVGPDKIVVYSSANCGYCRAAIHFLSSVKGIEADVVDLTGDWAARTELIKRTGHRTVPQIFIGETFVGGFDELRALDSQGKLDLLLSQVTV
jgi:glutaredoxin 3